MTNNAPLSLNGLRIFGYKSPKMQRFYLLKIAFHKCNLGCARNISCKLSSALAGTRFHDPPGPVFLYPTNAFRSFASGLEAHVVQRPVRGGEAIKTHRKVSDFQGYILI